jgi:hypothetical protein
MIRATDTSSNTVLGARGTVKRLTRDGERDAQERGQGLGVAYEDAYNKDTNVRNRRFNIGSRRRLAVRRRLHAIASFSAVAIQVLDITKRGVLRMKAYSLVVEWKETDLDNDEHPSFTINPGTKASSVAADVSLPHEKEKWYWVSSSFILGLDSHTGQKKGEPSRCAHGFDTPAAAEEDARRSVEETTLLREVDPRRS